MKTLLVLLLATVPVALVMGGITVCDPAVRQYDGGCNNLARPELGKARTAFSRGPEGTAFHDNVTQARQGPNVRTVSLQLSTDDTLPGNDHGMTLLAAYWGQLAAHDFAATRSMVPEEGLEHEAHVTIPITDPVDPMYGDGNQSMLLSRSHLVIEDGVGQVINEISHYIDLNQVYSSDEAVIHRLRAHEGGRMRTASYDVADAALSPNPIHLDNQLPNSMMVGVETVDDLAGNNPPESHLVGGDFRVIENAVLAMYHLLWVREHNRYAGLVEAANPEWTDEQIFQRARAWTIGVYQHIMIDEYLRSIVGEVIYNAVRRYNGYNPDVDPSVSTLFSTSAFRFGHSTLPETIPVIDLDRRSIGSLPMAGLFHNNLDPLSVNLITRGPANLAFSLTQFGAMEMDSKLVDAMRSFPGNFDVFAANVMRSRLNGIPVFNEIVKAFHPAGAGGDLYLRRGCTDEDENSEDYDSETCFLNVANNAATARKLRQVYGKVKYVDPYVGLLMEDPIADSLFGPIQTAIVVDQFVRLRDGDRFWYENTENGVFDASEVAEIKARSMADVISDNFGVPRAKLQDFVFLSPRAVK
jgi:hypothetical protein